MSVVKIEDVLGLAQPATALVHAIARGLGGFSEPMRMRWRNRAQLQNFRDWHTTATELGYDPGSADLSLAQAAEIRISMEHERKQAARERIAFEAVEAFREETPAAPQDHIEDEWLDTFWNFAERASSSDLQSLWARVLSRKAAGQQISARTLSFLSTLSRAEAELISSNAKLVVVGSHEGQEVPIFMTEMAVFRHRMELPPPFGSDLVQTMVEFPDKLFRELGLTEPSVHWSNCKGSDYVDISGARFCVTGPSGERVEDDLLYGKRVSTLGLEVLSLLPRRPAASVYLTLKWAFEPQGWVLVPIDKEAERLARESLATEAAEGNH